MGSSFISSKKCITGLVAGIVLAIPAMQVEAESTHVLKGSKAASLTSCVVPQTEEVRRNHMDHLKHDRDEAVIDGDRSIKYSLAACVDCHAASDGKGGYVPVNAEDQFCDGCHEYVAVELPCFQCHRTTPESGQKKLGSTGMDRFDHHRLNASSNLDLHGSLDSYLNESAELQRD